MKNLPGRSIGYQKQNRRNNSDDLRKKRQQLHYTNLMEHLELKFYLKLFFWKANTFVYIFQGNLQSI